MPLVAVIAGDDVRVLLAHELPFHESKLEAAEPAEEESAEEPAEETAETPAEEPAESAEAAAE